MRSIYDQDDLFLALARCLEERDLNALSRIEREVMDLLQPFQRFVLDSLESKD